MFCLDAEEYFGQQLWGLEDLRQHVGPHHQIFAKGLKINSFQIIDSQIILKTK